MKNEEVLWEDTEAFVAPITQGTVIKVYDGDTITIASKLPYNDSPLYRLSVRLNGIDTPEMKPSKNLPNREEHIKKAHEAKDFLSNLILNKIFQKIFF